MYECVYIYVRVKVLVTQLCLCDPMDCSPPGSSICGILQAGILEWIAISFSRVISACQLLDHCILSCTISTYQLLV